MIDQAMIAAMKKAVDTCRQSPTVKGPSVEVKTPAEEQMEKAIGGFAHENEPDQERDDGMRFKCSDPKCGEYVKPDPEGSGMNCDDCGQWFTLCDKCMPDVESYSSDAVWLCPECR